MTRRDEIAAGMGEVRGRIDAAAAAVGRHPEEITLVVVTKFFPVSDIEHLKALGVVDVGENRHQEAAAKAAQIEGVRWHFIGGLQSNKSAAVAAYADVVHSVDRVKVAHALARGADQHDRHVEVLLQVSLDPPDRAGRAGAAAAELPALAAVIDDASHLHLRGLMAVAPLDEDPVEAFARLSGIRAEFCARHPQATWLSAGMSGDLEAAVAAGATHVRVGSAILGSRPTVP